MTTRDRRTATRLVAYTLTPGGARQEACGQAAWRDGPPCLLHPGHAGIHYGHPSAKVHWGQPRKEHRP